MKFKNLMLSTTLFGILLVCCMSTANSNFVTLIDGRQIDKSLVGVWEGTIAPTENNKISKSWKITRKSDGTFLKLVVISIGGRRQQFKKSGTWYIEKGTYYESEPNSTIHAKFYYSFVNKSNIEFRSADSEKNIKFIETIDSK